MDQINFFKCLADETRFNIVMLVLGNNEQCVKISRHLALLRSSGLLQDRRQGQWVYYSLNPNLPIWCVDVLNTLKNADLQPKVAPSFQQINSYCE